MARSRPTLDISLPRDTWRAQPTPRRDVRTLCRWLEGALPGGSAGIETLLARLHGPLAERRHLVAVALIVAHLRGHLRGSRWQRLTGIENADPRDVDREMDRVWDALAGAKLVRPTLLYHPGVKTVGPGSRSYERFPPSLVARWVRTRRWYLMEQDEDLFLFEPEYIEPLLRGAAEPDAEKRDYARAIVAHAARDAACAVVVAPQYAGPDESLAAFAPRYVRWAKVARETGAIETAEYLERLASYGTPRTFDARAQVRVRETERGWTGSVPHSGFARAPRVHIDRETGAIALVKRTR
ncbi:hypothetical protein [Sandaracinus amylolyticus]|uniref:hypothetical protein n=1 Tax=Sandaracinus amylolyticus TaxID=927083 RepID=UPI001F166997|nr:hypothetical protein [Sandaracinus amylolyticus]UJR84234.1 Hypothetical protein I5071_63060 [Sandaracinus amylolyticus]